MYLERHADGRKHSQSRLRISSCDSRDSHPYSTVTDRFDLKMVQDKIVNGNQKCSDFGNSECSIFGIKTTVLLASVVL